MNNPTPRIRLTRKVILGLILLATVSSQTVNCNPVESRKKAAELRAIIEALTPAERSQLKQAGTLNFAKSSKLSSNVKLMLNQAKFALQFVLKNSKNILTRNMLIATLVAIGPLFTIYSYFFPPAFVTTIIRYLAYAAAKGGFQIGAPVAQGFLDGIMAGILANKWTILGFTSFGLTIAIVTAVGTMATGAIGLQLATEFGKEIAPKLAVKIAVKLGLQNLLSAKSLAALAATAI